MPEVAGERVPRDLGERPGHLDSGRPAANHDEGQQRGPLLRIALPLRVLERQQHTPPDLEGILERLESGRDAPPLVVSEVRVGRPGGDDQEVVVDHAVGQEQAIALAVHADGLREQHFDVLLPAENPADRRGDVARRERRHRHLIQQRLEHVMVAPIDDRDLHRLTSKRAGRVQPTETSADNHDSRHAQRYRTVSFQFPVSSCQFPVSGSTELHCSMSRQSGTTGDWQLRTAQPRSGIRLATSSAMTMTNRLTRWGGARLSRRVSRSIPILGAAIAAATIVATMRRKGVISGALDTGLNALPGIGAAKNVIELARGKDFFPDRERPAGVRRVG